MDVKNLIRAGVVSAVFPERCACRVTFEDRDGLVSAELPVLQSSCLNNKFYSLPDVGDSVVVLSFPNDQSGNSGVILGSFYTEKNPSPADNQEITMIKFGEGSSITFNRADSSLTIDCKGEVIIKGKTIQLNP